MIRSFLTIALASAITAAVLVAPAHADLNRYVEKYYDAKVSEKAIDRLAPYELYINYFTGFNYFLPNHKVSRDFLRALILAESGANADAVSAKNALGLGQILYPTGKKAAEELSQSKTNFLYVPKEKLRNLSREDLFDPAVNILLTCYLIAKYNYKFSGKLELVLSAWNAGEYTESLAMGQHAPYEETKDLIGKVNGYYLYLLKKRDRRI